MSILRERETWQRPKPRTAKPRDPSALTSEEREYVRAALQVLRRRLGSVAALAEAMGITHKTLENALGRRGKAGAGHALRASRVAGVPVEDVLSGAWPKAGACPMCGRCEVPR